MSDPTIDRDIAIPPRNEGKWGRVARQMQVGDSVLCDGVGNGRMTSLVAAMRRLGMKHTGRKIGAMVRVWRVE